MPHYAAGLALEQVQQLVGLNNGHSRSCLVVILQGVFFTSNPEFG